MVKKTPAYKNKLRALELERSGGTTNKKKTNKQMNKYELVKSFLKVIISFHRCDFLLLMICLTPSPVLLFRIIL